MKHNLQFDFVVNKQDNTLTIRREFLADQIQLVWDCYTKSELLNQWFAPAPLTTKTKSMIPGRWSLALCNGRTGTEYWGWTGLSRNQTCGYYTCSMHSAMKLAEINKDLPDADPYFILSIRAGTPGRKYSNL